jgi:hypothetical protein
LLELEELELEEVELDELDELEELEEELLLALGGVVVFLPEPHATNELVNTPAIKRGTQGEVLEKAISVPFIFS